MLRECETRVKFVVPIAGVEKFGTFKLVRSCLSSFKIG